MNCPTVKLLAFLFIFLIASCTSSKVADQQPAEIPTYRDPCADIKPLGFQVDQVSGMFFGVSGGSESPARLVELGVETAQELADSLQPVGCICEIPVSLDTRALIEQARGLAADGKTAQALQLLEGRLQQFQTRSAGMHLAKAFMDADWRNDVRDILAMAAEVYDLGGDPQPFHAAANEIFRANAGMELGDADLLNSLRIEYEAGLLGEEEIEEQARRRVSQIADEMIDASLEDFDPCSADRKAVTDLLNTAAQATLLGAEGLEPGEARYEAVKAKAQLALSYQWNEYVRQKGLAETLLEPAPPCAAAGELEVRIFSVCSQNWAEVGKISFRAEPGEGAMEIQGEGHISYSEQAIIGNELDCSVNIDADVLLSGKFTAEAGIRRVEFSPSFSSDGHYLVVGRTTPIRDEGVYPFNGFGAFVMPWVDGSVIPESGQHIIRYTLRILQE